MKKIILTMIFSLFYIVSASAGPGINVGISGNLGVFHGEATENENGDIDRDDATGVVGYGSVFIEKTLGERLAIGVDYVPQSLESEEASTSRLDKTTDDTGSTITNKVSLDMMINHGKAVRKGIKKSLMIVDMPKGTYEKSASLALKNAKKNKKINKM